VQPPIASEPNGKDDEDQMDDIVANIGKGYDLGYTDPPLEVYNFYKLLAALEGKVHDE
jgi:hypothetical protein